jgi:hypothetical protein
MRAKCLFVEARVAGNCEAVGNFLPAYDITAYE